jgi:hypothetical protein
VSRLLLALSITLMLLGAALGAYAFGCKQDAYGADHVFFRAQECFQSRGTDGSVFLECRRVVSVGGAK